ncbi:MAG: FKBP-type peptidyl-prolyl cis-trans isomerase [Bacteroidetes bacterium]|nr:FKBP-type peptidyl-prolyl cis-trans isomerase [Bacteroidota bacterium]
MPQQSQKSAAQIKENIKQQLIKANQHLAQREIDNMNYYAKSHQLPFVQTASGIRYYVYKPSAKGDSIKEGMKITMDYNVSLLDGTLCYSSQTDGAKTFIVGHEILREGQEKLESGIHRGVQFLKRGDKAILLIPSPLAQGLLGDMKKIPPQMPIVYDIYIH